MWNILVQIQSRRPDNINEIRRTATGDTAYEDSPSVKSAEIEIKMGTEI
jgi:hypothetical protein